MSMYAYFSLANLFAIFIKYLLLVFLNKEKMSMLFFFWPIVTESLLELGVVLGKKVKHHCKWSLW